MPNTNYNVALIKEEKSTLLLYIVVWCPEKHRNIRINQFEYFSFFAWLLGRAPFIYSLTCTQTHRKQNVIWLTERKKNTRKSQKTTGVQLSTSLHIFFVSFSWSTFFALVASVNRQIGYRQIHKWLRLRFPCIYPLTLSTFQKTIIKRKREDTTSTNTEDEKKQQQRNETTSRQRQPLWM